MTETQIRRISYSELKNFTECSYRHKLIYTDKLPYFSGNEYTAFGTAIHAVCEEVVPNNSKNAMEIFELNFLKELTQLKEEGHVLNRDMVNDMRLQAKPICEQVIPAVNEYFTDFEVVSVEEQLLEPMDDIESYGKKFKGFIDMVIKTPDGKHHIIDWKTCSWGWSRDKKSDPMTTYQLTLYKKFFCEKHNIDPEKVETYFGLLKRTAKEDNVEIFRVTSGPRKTTNALKVLTNSCNIINKGITIKNRNSCARCPFNNTEHCKR